MSTLDEVGERDGWRCWLCDEPVDPDASVNADRGPSVDAGEQPKKGKKAPAVPERLAHRACNTRKGAVAAVVPWGADLFVVDPAPIVGVVDRLRRKRGREVVGRCPTQADADAAGAWLLDRLSRFAPDLDLTAGSSRAAGSSCSCWNGASCALRPRSPGRVDLGHPCPMTHELSMGQNVPLQLEDESVEALRVTVSWLSADDVDLDLSALLLTASGRVRHDGDFVFYNQPEDADGSVRLIGKSQDETHSVDRLLINTDAVPDEIHRLVVLVSGNPGTDLSDIQGLSVSVTTADERSLCAFAAPPLNKETAIALGEVYRRDASWRFRAVGQGYDSGLAGVAMDYGISVETEDDEDASPEQTPPLDADPTAEPSQVVASTALALPMAPATASRTTARPIRTRKRAAGPAAVRALTLGDDESWKAARLFPVVGIGGPSEQERRATSALLSVLMGVKEFGRAITGRLGAPAGLLETYLEVPFPLEERSVIPDGVLRIARGTRVWTALLEVKTGSNLLARPQVEDYLAVAKARGYDAVITLSNELPATAGEHPVGVDRRKLRKVSLHHLSWAEVVHEATMQLSHRGIADATQAWVLSELVRYLQHPRSGASGFEDMGAAWVTVRDAVVAGTLRSGDRRVSEVAASWDRLIRQVCLRKTGELGTDVTPVGARAFAADPAARTGAVVKGLIADGAFTAGVRIPGTVGAMSIVANLRTSQVEVSVDVAGPTEGRPLTRVNWLLRQLEAAPDGLRIDALASRKSDARCELLSTAKADPKLLLPEDGAPKTYRLTLTTPLGTKRGIGRGGFITSVQVAVDDFYRDVMEKLHTWSPPPPKLPAHDAAADEDQPEATDHPQQDGDGQT